MDRPALESAAAWPEGFVIDRTHPSSRPRRRARVPRPEPRPLRAPRVLPAVSYPPDLPVSQRKDEIKALIAEHQVVIVCGETGSGKTTQLPKICLELGRGARALIGHTQPRRIAARSVAQRIADELNVPLGQQVGFQVRFADQLSEQTCVKLMTDGILLAETQHDPNLRRYDTIIIDEAHERSLNIDFLLGYLKRLLPRRPDLKIIITSATIDPESFSRHFDGAPVIEVSGRTYPVETRYRPLVTDDPDEADLDQEQAILAAVEELMAEGPGDILVFLPGEREIRETADALRKHADRGVEILPLYSRLSWNEQKRVFQPHPGRRIVLATNVAETSLTVPGIRYVVDPGLARISRYTPRTRVQRLPIEPISQASANQRAGRCGRVGPGVCIRLYSEKDFLDREPYTPPEILRTNLAAVILQMKALRLGAIEKFPFLEPPRRASIREGYDTLHELGALDEHENLTPLGRELARLPIDPRLARMILAAVEENCLREVLPIAAALSIQDPRERPLERRDAADELHARFNDEQSDFLSFLKLWDFYHEQKEKLTHSRFRRMCRENFLSYLRLREWSDVHRQLKELVAERGWKPNGTPAEYDAIHRALLSGLLTSVGQRGDGREYTGTWERKFLIHPASGLAAAPPRWIVAAELVETTRLYARTVARIDPGWIERLGQHLVKRTYSEPRYSEKSARVVADEKVTLFGLEIVPRRTVHYGPIDPAMSRDLFIHHALVMGEYRTDAPYTKHNRRLIREIEALEDKTRKRGLMRTPEEIHEFFSQRVPEGVYNGPLFEKWRRQAERQDKRLLFLSREDVLRPEADEVPEHLFPGKAAFGSTVLPLDYRLDPGTSHDGVTVTVPLEAFTQLREERLDWLVPGMLEEKIAALIKSLPKGLRTRFLPANEFARRCAEQLPDVADHSLIESLAACLRKMTGADVPLDAFRPDAIPDHLRMNVRVVDDQGRPLAVGRNLRDLRERLGSKLKASFAKAAKPEFQRDRITEWDFGELPEQVEIRRAGIRMVGYPTLIDRGDSVSLRVLDAPSPADHELRFGLRRLFILKTRGELQFQVDHLPSLNALRLHYATLGDAAELRRELIELVADRAFFGDRDDALDVADARTFESRVNEGWKRIGAAAAEVGGLALSILQAFHQVDRRLSEALPASWQPVVDDVQEQIGHLFKQRFLSRTPMNWLGQYPRYLAAIERRLDKLPRKGLDRDRAEQADVSARWRAYLARAEDHRRNGVFDPELETYRWMIEEYRVSLFAQELGTLMPVSPKRLDAQWARTVP